MASNIIYPTKYATNSNINEISSEILDHGILINTGTKSHIELESELSKTRKVLSELSYENFILSNENVEYNLGIIQIPANSLNTLNKELDVSFKGEYMTNNDINCILGIHVLDSSLQEIYKVELNMMAILGMANNPQPIDISCDLFYLNDDNLIGNIIYMSSADNTGSMIKKIFSRTTTIDTSQNIHFKFTFQRTNGGLISPYIKRFRATSSI